MKTSLPMFVLLALASSPVLAQSINVDFGEPPNGPSPTYAAAGLAGVWNSLRCDHSVPNPGPHAVDDFMVDLQGNPTAVRLHQYGGTALVTSDDPATTGDDEKLLDDALFTYSIPLKTCLFFNGLENGTYEVLTYAFVPNQPQVTNRVFIDFTPGNFLTSGAFPGSHQLGVTYTRHIVQVTSGFMGPHAGLPDGGDTGIGSALNGIQLRKLSCAGCTAFCFGDGNGTACPCGNSGLGGHGCQNSLGTGGAQLTASGTRSVAGDTVRLTVAGLPASTSVLFFQGTTPEGGGQGFAFGDGLRCAGGAVIRLGLRTASGGMVELGSGVAGDAPLSAAGAVPPGGGTRHYQAWYRNSASFCTSAPYNLSNGMTIPWLP